MLLPSSFGLRFSCHPGDRGQVGQTPWAPDPLNIFTDVDGFDYVSSLALLLLFTAEEGGTCWYDDACL